MGHGDNLDVIAAEDVHQAEGVSREHVPPSSVAEARPGPRIRSNGIDGLS